MMSCRELADLLGDYCSGELPREQCQGLENHLGQCPPCLALVESYKITLRLSRRLPCLPVPPGLLPRLESALRDVRPET